MKRARSRKPLPKWRNADIAKAVAALRAEGFKIKEDPLALYFSAGTSIDAILGIRDRVPELRKISFRVSVRC